MEKVLIYIIEQWPVLGILLGLLAGAGWLIYHLATKQPKTDKLNQTIEDKLEDIYDRICDRFDTVNERIAMVDEKVTIVDNKFEDKIALLEDKIAEVPMQNLVINNEYAKASNDIHIKQIEDLMLLGGHLHQTMKKYTKLINTDHIFIGSFHNGSSNLSGIPFCKFDIISECYCENKVKHDHEFAPVYKDADILRYGSLFPAVMQNDYMLFHVNDEVNDMEQYEDIMWRRMKGLNIRQLAVKILRDPDNQVSGFVGAVRYDDDDMNMDMLVQCGIELERIYSVNKYKQDADKE